MGFIDPISVAAAIPGSAIELSCAFAWWLATVGTLSVAALGILLAVPRPRPMYRVLHLVHSPHAA